MKWKNDQPHATLPDWHADNLVNDKGEILASIRHPSPDSYIPMYHYRCHQPGCGDNLGTTQALRSLKVHVRHHQRDVHGEA